MSNNQSRLCSIGAALIAEQEKREQMATKKVAKKAVKRGPRKVAASTVKYLGGGFPKQILPDRYLVHNHVYPVAECPGVRGSRMWLQSEQTNLELCDCGWKPGLGPHYRIS